MSYSPPKYPASIPNTTTDLPDQTDDIDWIEAWIYNYVKKELIAVMTELGTDPAGTEATVAARLTAIEAAGVDESVIMNIYLNSFRIAILGSYAVMNMAKGISDEYEDETGIDTTASTNEVYDSANDLYSPTAIGGYASQYPTQDDDHVKSTTKFTTDFWAYFATDPTKSLDGSWGSNNWLSAQHSITEQRFHIDLGSAKIIKRIYYENSHLEGTYTNTGVKNFTLWGSNTGVGSFDDLVYANDEGWTEITCSQNTFDEHAGSDIADPKYITVTNTTAYRYYALKFADNYTEANWLGVRRIELQTVYTANMTLISEKFTADSTPDDARIIIFEEDVDAITLNTDIKAYVSRDDGANWTQITLTDEGNYSGSKRILSGTADISGQPEDTDMVYKIESLNNKDLKIHGAALSWA